MEIPGITMEFHCDSSLSSVHFASSPTKGLPKKNCACFPANSHVTLGKLTKGPQGLLKGKVEEAGKSLPALQGEALPVHNDPCPQAGVGALTTGLVALTGVQ